uniref:Uncharacterized protein n=1 Tax=Arundo donax TaxID=35708 RepID=A0A0A9BTS1_ARUDO
MIHPWIDFDGAGVIYFPNFLGVQAQLKSAPVRLCFFSA